MNKVYIVMISGYYNEEYWDLWTHVEMVFSTRDKAEKYIKDIEGIRYDEDCESWKVGDEDVDAYTVRFYDICEETVDN